MQTGSSGTLIGWKSGQTTFVPLWDRMEGAWLWTQVTIHLGAGGESAHCLFFKPFILSGSLFTRSLTAQ
jgi:hypothetical protein